MCYYYDGDGVCEDFERETGVRDCGLYTPSGFLDQWAATVEVSHEQKPYCSGEVAAGYPAVTKVRPKRVFCVEEKCFCDAFFYVHAFSFKEEKKTVLFDDKDQRMR